MKKFKLTVLLHSLAALLFAITSVLYFVTGHYVAGILFLLCVVCNIACAILNAKTK